VSGSWQDEDSVTEANEAKRGGWGGGRVDEISDDAHNVIKWNYTAEERTEQDTGTLESD